MGLGRDPIPKIQWLGLLTCVVFQRILGFLKKVDFITSYVSEVKFCFM